MTTESLSVTIEGEVLTVEIGTVAAPAVGGGSGDVVGPAGATDDRIAAFDGVTGKLIKQGSVTATAVASHLGSTSNPHSVTAAQVGADATGTAAAAVVAHAGATDPHGDRAFATSAISTHAAASDPHGDRNYTDTGLALKAPIASPTFTGVPAAPTAAGGTNTTQVATTAFVTSAVASAVAGLLEFIGNVDASTNPNYSAANKGDSYLISVAGKIGGASGKSVEVGDLVVASADNAGGTEASVGTSWFVLEHNLAGALLTANALSELSGVASTARSNLGLVIGTNVQAYDVDLTTWAGITPGTGVGTALGTNVGAAGAFVTNGGALGTPSSGTLTNATGLPLSGIAQSGATTGQVPTWNGSAYAPTTPSGGSPAGSSGQMQYNNASAFGAANLWRESADIIALRNSTTAQTFYVYDTYTDASNYGRLAINTSLTGDWVQVAAETAGTAGDNYGIALTPTGTGAISAHVPDSTAAGGNARGAYSIDWQRYRSAASQVASGEGSVIAGGFLSTASGEFSVIGGGFTNTASGTQATVAGGIYNVASGIMGTVGGGRENAAGQAATVAGGYGNIADGPGSWIPGGAFATTRGIGSAYAYASGFRAATGDAQVIGQPVRRTTTDATPVSLAADGTPAATTVMVLPASSTLMVTAIVAARDSSGNSAGWIAQALFKRDGSNNTSRLGSATVTAIGTPDAAINTATIDLIANDTLESAQIQVTGVAATTIYWVGELKCVQVL